MSCDNKTATAAASAAPAAATDAKAPSSIADFTANDLQGKPVHLKDYVGKVSIVINVATLCGYTISNYTQLNELVTKYKDKGLQVLAFPCNQFGYQENLKNEEILNALSCIRPGKGFVPAFPLFGRIEVNGENAHPLYKWLKQTIPFPSDDALSLANDNARIIWKPVTRADIAWNFEKFLIGRNGKPIKRYSKAFAPNDMVADIEAALKEAS